jgi:TetR/AcrR family transcriptional repressor of mexJK operon
MTFVSEALLADNRERVLQAAAEVFKEQGFRASMDRVAERAGVVKQTLYNHFRTKNELFAEVLRVYNRNILVSLDGDAAELRPSLIRFGMALRALALAPEHIAVFRVLAGEAPRFPELSRTFYAEGPQRTTRQLATFLTTAMTEGALRRDDPEFAASMLISMLLDPDRMHQLFCLEPVAAANKPRVTRIVDRFLRAFAP